MCCNAFVRFNLQYDKKDCFSRLYDSNNHCWLSMIFQSVIACKTVYLNVNSRIARNGYSV